MPRDSERQGSDNEMVLVPRVPTKAMLDAAWADALGEDASGVWGSMIAAWLEQRERGEV